MEPLPAPLPDAHDVRRWRIADVFRPGAAQVRVLHHRDYAIDMHSHDFIEVNLVAAGSGWHHLEEHVFPVVQGDAFVVPEGLRHGYERRGRLDVEHLLLHPRFIAEHLHRLQAVPGFLPLFTIEPFFRAHDGVRHHLQLDRQATAAVVALLAAVPDHAGRDPAELLAGEGLTLAAIARLCRAWAGAAPPAASHARMDAVLSILATIEQRYAEPLRLDTLAAAAGLSPSACCRLFRTVTGVPPMDHLRQVRIRQAGLLLRGGQTLADVAAACGFCDAAHLARVFRRVTGSTPGAWRRGG